MATTYTEPTPRAYRPSYSYRYGPNFPPSASMTFVDPIGDAWPSHYVTPRPIIDFPTDLETHRRQRAAAMAADINRRSTDTAFTRPELGHSAPTVANSRLTVSVSCNNISQPTSKYQRLRFPNLRRNNTPASSKPSRIPTPVHGRGVEGEAVRYVSTPVLPSQKTKKEIIQPKTLRLLGPISPTRQQAPMPKSRTMGMLSSLTSSFSRSNLNLSSTRQASSTSARASDPTVSISSTSPPPLPTFTTNIRQVHIAQPFCYWCGRFQTLADHTQNENLALAMEDPKVLARYVPTIAESSSLSNITNVANNSKHQPNSRNPNESPKTKNSYEVLQELEARNQADIDQIMKAEEEKRNKKVLLKLEALCVTNDARNSLWEWQLAYARTVRNGKYLPHGGRMVDHEKGGWVSKMGRVISGGRSVSGSMSSLGRRSGLGVLSRKKESVMGLRQHDHARGSLGQVY